MGTPAAVAGDRISGTCTRHLIPGPTGAPSPAPPLPFSSPLTVALATRTLIKGKPAAVQGSSGLNTPPHVGLHPSDPFMLASAQIGRVVKGSASVLIEGRPAAKTGSTCTINAGAPGQLAGTATTVLIGG
jgi:uncharacterized Zn-binding protein involved in type VI secretion